MTDTSVKFFESTQAGAPTSTGQVGSLIGLLDACLVNGFGQVTVTSLVVADNVATLTVSAGHGLTMTGNTGPVILIEGATPAELNGEWRVASVTNSTTLTFTTSELTDCTATGTITVKCAPAGWTKRYTGTNKAVYARERTGASPALVRVQDDGTPTAYSALIALYETMTDVDTGTNSTASTARYIHHSSTTNSTARQWRLIADHRSAYLFIKSDGTNWYSASFIGDINSYKTGDLYPCLLNTANSTAISSSTFYLLVSNSLMLRAASQTAGVITVAGASHIKSGNFSTATAQTYPSAIDGRFHAWPVEIWETAGARGMMPGLWNPIHTGSSITDGTLITDVPQLDGRVLLCQPCYNTSFVCALDITGPWQ